MADLQHTPGPWMYQGTNPWFTGGVEGGEFVQWSTFTVSANTLDRDGESYYFVATVSNVNDEAQNEANARLIAAAPEMLVMLREVEGYAEMHRDLFDRVGALIKKITGGAP